jgi:hypothetical protein
MYWSAGWIHPHHPDLGGRMFEALIFIGCVALIGIAFIGFFD